MIELRHREQVLMAATIYVMLVNSILAHISSQVYLLFVHMEVKGTDMKNLC